MFGTPSVEEQRERLRQRALFDEIQAERERDARVIEWELGQSHQEHMKQLIERERKRMLETVLPKRYELASVELHPLAVEYVVREDAGGTA